MAVGAKPAGQAGTVWNYSTIAFTVCRETNDWIDQPLATQRTLPQTPDGRYFVVRGRLWRLVNPLLPAERRSELVAELMEARRNLKRDVQDKAVRAEARAKVDAVKVSLGERGPVWWTDGAPDYNRRLVKNTPYATWFAVQDQGRGPQGPVESDEGP